MSIPESSQHSIGQKNIFAQSSLQVNHQPIPRLLILATNKPFRQVHTAISDSFQAHLMLNISLAQMNVVQGDIPLNLEKSATFIQEASQRGSQLICFPEMWTTGFNFAHNTTICQKQDATITTLATLARDYGLWISGSLLFYNDAGSPTNTHMLFNATGNIVARYDKVHLFSPFQEDRHIAPGNHLTLAETPWGKAGLSVCYDIRFCELFRQYALQGACIILSPTAFPNPRLDHWRTLIRARAIENQLFMIGTNQVGQEALSCSPGTPVTYCGHSCVIDPWGTALSEADDHTEVLLTTEFDLSTQQKARKAIPIFADRRPEVYEL